ERGPGGEQTADPRPGLGRAERGHARGRAVHQLSAAQARPRTHPADPHRSGHRLQPAGPARGSGVSQGAGGGRRAGASRWPGVSRGGRMLGPKSLKARLIMAVLCLTTVGLLAFGAVGTVLLHRSLVEEVDHRLEELTRAAPPGPPAPQDSEHAPPLPTDLRRIVLDPDGRVVRSLGQTADDPGSPDLAGTDPAQLRE